MPEAEQIEHAIAALEAQRSLLGDVVVDPAVAALREKLASLRAEAATALLHGEERKIVTVLFADLVGFTALSQRLDPEDVREIDNDYFSHWREVITAYRGEVEKFLGDAVMAVFGLRLAMRVGINSEPVLTYLVERAKPRAFRSVARGVEGVETRLVGRDAELASLQKICRQALNGEAHCVTVVGEPGVGKSRLLLELIRWLDQWPEPIAYFRARTSPNSQTTTYGLIRDMFSRRFEILDTDPAATAMAKFRVGMAGALGAHEADQVGQFVGFDFFGQPGGESHPARWFVGRGGLPVDPLSANHCSNANDHFF